MQVNYWLRYGCFAPEEGGQNEIWESNLRPISYLFTLFPEVPQLIFLVAHN
jgi:hypothetical protein